MQVTQPPISAQEFKLIFILNLPQKLSPIYTNSSIHPSDLPQKLFQTYTIHPSFHPYI